MTNRLQNVDLEAMFDLSIAPEAGPQIDAESGKTSEEIRCPKCNGTGKFFGTFGKMKGKPIGDCFACKGRPGVRREAVEEAAARVNVSKIREAFDTAKRNGAKRPKMTIATIKFSLAPDTGKNPGAIYVCHAIKTEVDRYSGREKPLYLGMIKGEDWWPNNRTCLPEDTAALVEIAQDVKAAAVAHGTKTETCCVCGAELTNKFSKKNKIGPTCARKYGWSFASEPDEAPEDTAIVHAQWLEDGCA